MHFGTFMEFSQRDGVSDQEIFREGLDFVDDAEAWGLASVWLAEFHFMPDRSVLGSPIVVAAAIAGRTERIRIGMAVYVLPLNNPLRIAEEVATVDQISRGRFDLGIGRSGFVRMYRSYGINYDESEQRFDEALWILKKAWKGEAFTFEGQHYQAYDARISPIPYSSSGPEMRMAATSAGTFEKVAKLGLPVFVGLRGDDLSQLADGLDRYRATWKVCGHDGLASAYLRVPLYAANTEQAAFEEPRENIIYYFDRQAALVAADAAARGNNNTDRSQIAKALSALSYDDILKHRVAFGTPTMLIERIGLWQRELGIDGVVLEMNAGGMLTKQQVRNSLRLLTQEIMPAFK